MEFSSCARNRADTLPDPSPFQLLNGQTCAAFQLAADVNSSTLYGRTVEYQTKFFGLMVTTISYKYAARPLRAVSSLICLERAAKIVREHRAGPTATLISFQ